MSYTPKKKKVQKAPVEDYAQSRNYYCCRCGLAYKSPVGNFPASHSPMYRGAGYYPMCRKCVDELYDDYRSELGSDRAAVRRLCMKMDLYWNDDIYNTVERQAGVRSRIMTYISRTNTKTYIDKTFDDTIAEEDAVGGWIPKPLNPDGTPMIPEPKPEKIVVPQEMIDFWGTGYEPEFYFELDRRYKNWTKDLEDIPHNEQVLYEQAARLEAIIAKDGADGKPIDKNVATLNNVMASLNQKPSQQKDATDTSYDNIPMGKWIERWEKSAPVPEPDESLKDRYGVIRYILTWFVGHAGRMLGKNTIYSKLYDEEVERLRVEKPQYEDYDDEDMVSDIFSIEDEVTADGS